MTDSCLFCRKIEGDVLYDDDRCAVVLHEDWAVRGHAMVVWKTHVENVSDLSLEDAAHLSQVHHAAEKALLAATGADRAVLLKLGIATPHLHLHIYPVSAALDRAAVMAIIDARVRAPRDEAFVREVRSLLAEADLSS
jgi:diadenosine tetraphosphate (Ap4A) HIT family hydrolase